ncbi:TPA: hypothetical protein ACTEIZ_001951 [Streptococcus agalactiae]
MRYTTFNLVTDIKTGKKDALGNDIITKTESISHKGRFTEWHADDEIVYGRDLTSSTRKMISNTITLGQAKKASQVKLDGKYYDIKSVKDLGRWRLLLINGYRL